VLGFAMRDHPEPPAALYSPREALAAVWRRGFKMDVGDTMVREHSCGCEPGQSSANDQDGSLGRYVWLGAVRHDCKCWPTWRKRTCRGHTKSREQAAATILCRLQQQGNKIPHGSLVVMSLRAKPVSSVRGGFASHGTSKQRVVMPHR